MRIVSIINQKGGCGKTTSAINLSGILARQGYRVLLVDLDPQSHCAAGLAIPEQRIDLDIGDAMLAEPSALNPQRLLWRVSRNLDLIPSRMKLAGLEAPRGGLAEKPDKERRLAGVLSALAGKYDLCIVDCSPSIGLLTYNALAAATDVLVPVETSFFALQGATKQVNTIKTMARRVGTAPRYWLVATIHDESSVLARDLLAELQRRFEQRVSPAVIRRDPTLKEAASFGQPIIEYNPQTTGAADYSTLAQWLVRVMGVAPGTTPLILHDPLGDEPPASVPPPAATSPAPAAPPMAAAMAQAPDAAPGSIEDMAAFARSMLLQAHGAPGHRPMTPAAPPRVPEHAAPAFAAASNTGTAVAVAPPPAWAPAPGVGVTPLVLVEPKPGDTPPVPSAVAQHLLGVRETRLGTLFVQPLNLGSAVAIAGDFNGWSAALHPMRRNAEHGVWELCVTLPPGRHRYQLVVDGRPMPDPHNPIVQRDRDDSAVSIVEVRGPS